MSFKSKPVSNEKAGVSQRYENPNIESNHSKTAETNTYPNDETMAIALAIAAAKSPNSKRSREPIQGINKTLPSLTVKPKKAKTSDLPTSGELTMNKVQNIFEGLQDESVSKKDETKKSSDSSKKGSEFPKDLWKSMQESWNRDKNPFESKKDEKDTKKTNPNLKLKNLLDDLK